MLLFLLLCVERLQNLVLPLLSGLELHFLLVFADVDLFHRLDLIVQLEVTFFALSLYKLGELLFSLGLI